MNWKKHNRQLVDGDIIRTKVSNKEHPKCGEYIYSIATGTGFGSSVTTMGNAIFVKHESFDLNEVIGNKGKKENSETNNRWERFWGIEILEEADYEQQEREDE